MRFDLIVEVAGEREELILHELVVLGGDDGVGGGGHATAVGDARCDFLMSGPRAPMILTHSNHVRLIVGFIDAPGNPQLIYVDPIWSEVDGIEFFRKGDLRAKEYEVMYLLDA